MTLNWNGEMISEIDKAIEKKYQEIGESRRVYRGINKLYEDLHFEKPYLADYVRRKDDGAGRRKRRSVIKKGAEKMLINVKGGIEALQDPGKSQKAG